MTTKEWIKVANDEMELLCSFIAKWHPGSKARNPDPMTITAPSPENFRRIMEARIEKEQTQDPVIEFREAIQAEDVGKAIGILNGAWCGVPESTSCWRIPGFPEAVDLMDDPPEDPREAA